MNVLFEYVWTFPGHDGLRSEVQGQVYDRIILVQLRMSMKMILDKRDKFLIASGCRPRRSFASLTKAYIPISQSRKSRTSKLFCLHHLVLRVLRRVEEPIPSDALASTPPVVAVSVRFRGGITD